MAPPRLNDGSTPTVGTNKQRIRLAFGVTLGALTAGLFISLTAGIVIGPVAIPALQVWEIVLHRLFPTLTHTGTWTQGREQIVWELRLPRVLLGACVGAGLSVVGTTLQALVRNPLADPYVFGITSGASAGATLVLALGIATFGSSALALAAFIGAVTSLALVLVLAGTHGSISPTRIILSGLAVAFSMSALTSFMVFKASTAGESGAAESVLFWLLGGLAGSRWEFVGLPAIAVLVAVVIALTYARALNTLLIGDETAATLGTDINRVRIGLFTLSALLTGVMVAVSGGIGFVGLMVPHAVRMVMGSDHRRVLPVAVLLGAIFLIWADVLARTVVAPQELPIGIITAVFGTPFFVLIMRWRSKDLRGTR